MLRTSIRWIGAAVIGSCIWGACQPSSPPPKEPTPLETASPVALSSNAPASPPRDAAALPIVEASPIDASPTPPNATLVIADAAPPAVVDAASPERSAPAKKVVTINTGACDDRELVPGCYDAFPAKVVCPAAMADVPDGALCGVSGKTQAPRACTYREGSCACAHTPYCGGAYPTFLQQQGMYWKCKPPRRPGDCPDAASSGQACSVEGQQCGSGGCGTSTSCTCTKGRFKCTIQHWAPPP